MDILGILDREWPVISAAPHLVVGGAIVVALIAFGIAWRLKASIDDGELRALRAQLDLAKDREQNALKKRDELEKQIEELRIKVEQGASKEELAGISKKVDNALLELKTANNAVHHALTRDERFTMGSYHGFFHPGVQDQANTPLALREAARNAEITGKSE